MTAFVVFVFALPAWGSFPGHGIAAQFSPDGTRLVFSSLVNHSHPALFTINVDGTDRRRVARSGWAEVSPAWQPRP